MVVNFVARCYPAFGDRCLIAAMMKIAICQRMPWRKLAEPVSHFWEDLTTAL